MRKQDPNTVRHRPNLFAWYPLVLGMASTASCLSVWTGWMPLSIIEKQSARVISMFWLHYTFEAQEASICHNMHIIYIYIYTNICQCVCVCFWRSTFDLFSVAARQAPRAKSNSTGRLNKSSLAHILRISRLCLMTDLDRFTNEWEFPELCVYIYSYIRMHIRMYMILCVCIHIIIYTC